MFSLPMHKKACNNPQLLISKYQTNSDRCFLHASQAHLPRRTPSKNHAQVHPGNHSAEEIPNTLQPCKCKTVLYEVQIPIALVEIKIAYQRIIFNTIGKC